MNSVIGFISDFLSPAVSQRHDLLSTMTQSVLNATTGSIFVARRAGTYDARPATAASVIQTGSAVLEEIKP